MFNLINKKPKQPPSNSQVRLCKRLGLEITPKMSRADVSKLLEISLQQEKYKAIYDEIQREEDAEFEREERAEYGDEIVDELKKWEKICDLNTQYFLLFKYRGKIQCEIVEIENAEIVEDKKPSISLSLLLPKKHRDKDYEDGGYYIEWEREISLKSNQIMAIEALPAQIDIFDVKAYELARTRCEEIQSEQAD